jgi:anthranilate synthase component I
MSALRLVSAEKLADTDTPVSAYLKLCQGRPDSFLLESVETKDITGRYSFVAFDPIVTMELSQDRVISRNLDGETVSPAADFFQVMRAHLSTLQCEPLPPLPSVGSLMGFVGYDAIRLIERLPLARPNSLPTARLVFPSCFAVFDHLRRVMVLLAIDEDENIAAKKIKDMEDRLRVPLVLHPRTSGIEVVAPPKDRFCQSVGTAQEYIKAGDIFQVVLSDSFRGRTDMSPFEVYRRLRVRSPSPYMFFADFGEYQLVGSSPETLVKVHDRIVIVRPIAGTRGRGSTPARDHELELEMLESEKECAEHIMLVDLARNDVGRVAGYGTVSVAPYMTVERYSHVMHIVSQVQGKLRQDADAVDAFIAGFPAGTVSGAPKVRAMEIIDELETDSRGPYAGAVGYFGLDGSTDTCIAIRMITFEGDRFTIRVGAGIVADSIPEMEYKEIQNKAAQSIYAVQAAAKGES